MIYCEMLYQIEIPIKRIPIDQLTLDLQFQVWEINLLALYHLPQLEKHYWQPTVWSCSFEHVPKCGLPLGTCFVGNFLIQYGINQALVLISYQ